MNEKQLAS